MEVRRSALSQKSYVLSASRCEIITRRIVCAAASRGRWCQTLAAVSHQAVCGKKAITRHLPPLAVVLCAVLQLRGEVTAGV